MKFRNFFFFSTILFLLLVSTKPCASAPGGGWAFVDSRLLLILHPSMANFDYSTGKFFRPGVAGKKPEELQKELNAAWNRIQPKLRELMSRQSRIIQGRADMLARRDETLNMMMSKAAVGKEKVRDYPQTIGDFEKKYNQELEGFSKQLADIDNQIKTLTDEAYSPVYLTIAESNQQLERIKLEIDDLIKQTANETGTAVVIDSSFGAPALKKSDKLCVIPTQTEPVDTLSSNLFHFFSNWEPPAPGQIPMADGTKVDAATHLVPRMTENKIQTLKQFLDFRLYLPQNGSTFSPGKFFVLGGVDLTPQVAWKIFSKYRIPQEIQNAYMYVVKEFNNFESGLTPVPAQARPGPKPSTFRSR